MLPPWENRVGAYRSLSSPLEAQLSHPCEPGQGAALRLHCLPEPVFARDRQRHHLPLTDPVFLAQAPHRGDELLEGIHLGLGVPGLRAQHRATGQGAMISASGRGIPAGQGNCRQRASVTNGTIGWSSRLTPSNTVTRTERAASRLASPESPLRRGLTSSRYQSAMSPQEEVVEPVGSLV